MKLVINDIFCLDYYISMYERDKKNLNRAVDSFSAYMLCHHTLDICVRRHVGHYGNMASGDQIKDGRSHGSMHVKKNITRLFFYWAVKVRNLRVTLYDVTGELKIKHGSAHHIIHEVLQYQKQNKKSFRQVGTEATDMK